MLQIRLAGFLGFTGVMCGALGSHAIEKRLKQITVAGKKLDDTEIAKWKSVWNTGYGIHLFGATVTLGLGAILMQNGALIPSSAARLLLLKKPNLITALVTGSTMLFSGSCYLATLFANRKFSVLAPAGGIGLMVGLALMMF
mmetsp:Transcript_9310/g.16241  ORF Transcript_9310/g.16241 Transcript_9310/m.16241 type:complete len:142 (+) Transcript_9310:188-613(+)|eukprot:CAMPEP_0184696198 /NCGR_PEP_ID=MMETSP0313-20130426/3569_1 /TAXON_ID=2792 /ORGANISM="Porphyridium aerugineum, Strain SAG 1380-2" /LENGTH=141 /DNA_ID=CAMNT_0027154775 /DNA_START=131 /DNA_END=556 /DNA_ORIENTATION=-